MADSRVTVGVERGDRFEIDVDGDKLIAYQGETIAAALVAAGKMTLRRTTKKGESRGMYCGIGVCHDCRMVVDGKPNTRVCQTLATPCCCVRTQEAAGKLEIDY